MTYELQKLFDTVYQNYNLIQKIEYKKHTLPTFNSKLYNNKFADVNINNLNNQYTTTIDEMTFYITVDKPNYKLMNKIVNRAYNFKRFSKNNYPLSFYIWLSNSKKSLPKKGTTLCPKHINSGSTLVYHHDIKKNGDISIWRKEEILKVLIHEMLHSLKYDYYAINDNLDRIVRKEYNVNKNINTNESYTETLATILNCMYYTIENNKDYIYFLALLKNEQRHSLSQVNKLLRYYGYNNYKELLRENSDKEFKQDTSVFSYYVLKAIALNNVIKFIKFSMKNNLRYPKRGDDKYYKILDIKVLDEIDYVNDKNRNLCMTIT